MCCECRCHIVFSVLWNSCFSTALLSFTAISAVFINDCFTMIASTCYWSSIFHRPTSRRRYNMQSTIFRKSEVTYRNSSAYFLRNSENHDQLLLNIHQLLILFSSIKLAKHVFHLLIIENLSILSLNYILKIYFVIMQYININIIKICSVWKNHTASIAHIVEAITCVCLIIYKRSCDLCESCYSEKKREIEESV